MVNLPASKQHRAMVRPIGRAQWHIEPGLAAYDETVRQMEARVAAIRAGTACELIWLVEHPPLYTAGTSAHPRDLLNPTRFRVHATGRGGQYTYHGPGQRVVYIMLDLAQRGRDVRTFVHELEGWMIDVLAQFGIAGTLREDRVGVWVRRKIDGVEREDKIGAIGIRVRRWVSYHGMALNISPDLEHFSGIVPCGITQAGVTSLHDLGVNVSMSEVDQVLHAHFERRFGALMSATPPPDREK